MCTLGSEVPTWRIPEVPCAIPNKAAYMHDETREKVVKVVASDIRKMKLSNYAFIFTILFSIYLTLHICPS